MTARGVLVGAAAALALSALVMMHGLPLAASTVSPAPTVHAMPMTVAHEGRVMPASTGVPVHQTSPDTPAPHGHILAHLCLAVLTSALLVVWIVLRRRPLSTLATGAPLAARARSFIPRAVGPPLLAELGLLRC